MNYYEAAKIRKKGFADLMADKLTSGQGVFSSVRSTLSDKMKARSTGIKKIFDPLNIAKTLTGGSNLAPAMLGRLLGRSSSDIKYFTGKREYTPRSESSYFNNYTPPSVSPAGSRKATRVLEKMLSFMEKSRTDDMQEQDTLDSFNELNEKMREDRHKEVMNVFIEATKAKRKAEKDMAREAKKRERAAKKEAPPPKPEAPKPQPKPEAPPAKTEAPPPKPEAPKPQPKPEAPPTAKPVETAPTAPTAAPAPPTVTPKPPIVKPAIEAAKTAAKTVAKVGDPVKKMIMQHEGSIPYPYKDTKGLWTIGVGHLIGDGKTLPPEYAAYKNNGGPYDKKNNKTPAMTDEQIQKLFDDDYEKHKAMAMKTPGWDLANETGQAAMIDLAFNMGGSWYKSWPNTSKALAQGDFEAAARGLKDSKWYTQVKDRGVKIVDMIRNGKKNIDISPTTTTNNIGEMLKDASETNADMKKDMSQGSAGGSTVIVQNNNTTQAKTNIHRAAPQEQLNPTMR